MQETHYVQPAVPRFVWWYIPEAYDTVKQSPVMEVAQIDAYITTTFTDDEGIRSVEVGALSRGQVFLHSRFGTGPGEPVWFFDAVEADKSLKSYIASLE